MTLKACLLGLAVSVAALCDSAAGIQWTAPANWKAQPQRPMRAATYVVPAAPGDKEDGECGVFYFGPGQGGSVEDNIKRWIGQFQPGGAEPRKASATAGAGLKMTTVEHSGTFMAGGPMTQQRTPKPGYRLLGAIVEAPEGNVFFKLTGPEKTVAAAKQTFDKMLQSVKK